LLNYLIYADFLVSNYKLAVKDFFEAKDKIALIDSKIAEI